MANMSYCRFENTLNDFKDYVHNIENYDDLSDSEQKAADRLYMQAQVYIDAYNDVTENDDENDDNDIGGDDIGD